MPSEKVVVVNADENLSCADFEASSCFYFLGGGCGVVGCLFVVMFSIANPKRHMAPWFWQRVRGNTEPRKALALAPLLQSGLCTCVLFLL